MNAFLLYSLIQFTKKQAEELYRNHGIVCESAVQSEAVIHATAQLTCKGQSQGQGQMKGPNDMMMGFNASASPNATNSNSNSNSLNNKTLSSGLGGLSANNELFHTVLVPLKGIDVLANGRYRVQLNTFMSGKKKFSRNSTNLYEVCDLVTPIYFPLYLLIYSHVFFMFNDLCFH